MSRTLGSRTRKYALVDIEYNSMSGNNDRVQDELALLEAMYPELIHCDMTARDLTYRDGKASFTVRLPDEYPAMSLPEVISANLGRTDLREPLRHRVKELSAGEEVLDSIVLAFRDLVELAVIAHHNIDHADGVPETEDPESLAGSATVVVWLHHLLNTNKRKQALSPASPSVAGLTKPGYPGVLIYSGPAKAVHEHVNELKHLNWQAFQVRLESDEEWHFAHGSGVIEVEAMKDIVAEIDAENRELFMEAMRMK